MRCAESRGERFDRNRPRWLPFEQPAVWGKDWGRTGRTHAHYFIAFHLTTLPQLQALFNAEWEGESNQEQYTCKDLAGGIFMVLWDTIPPFCQRQREIWVGIAEFWIEYLLYKFVPACLMTVKGTLSFGAHSSVNCRPLGASTWFSVYSK